MTTPFPKSVANSHQATPADFKEAENRISKAITGLVLGTSADHAFYACLIMNTLRHLDQKVGTACMTAKEMLLNPLFVNTLTTEQVKSLLAHEVMHKVLHHLSRLGGRNPRAANKAMDACINDILKHGGVGEMIPGGIDQPGAREHTWEELYQEPPPGDGSDYGNGDGGYGIGDDIDPSPMSEAELKELENEVKVQVNQAAKAAKQRGTMSAELSRLVDEITISVTPWYEKLRHLMTGLTRGDYSWQRPNRRMVSSGIYLPSVTQVPRMGLVVFGIDTSGSIDQHMLNRFLGEVNKILEDCEPELVKIIWCDADAYEGEEFTPDEYPITSKMVRAKGGGGTAFGPVFDMVDELQLQPNVLVYLTDGYGDQQSLEMRPEYPVVWVSTDSVEGFQFGEVIKMGEHDGR